MDTLQVAPMNARAQVGILHNSAFPFSSPNPDDHGSLKSIRTGNTALSHNPFQSPGTSAAALTDEESGTASELDAWHLERYSELSEAADGRGGRPGLQVITDFSKPTYHTSNLVVDRVKAKQAQTRRNRARSIISQRAVKVLSGEVRGKTSPRPRGDARATVKATRAKKKATPRVADEAADPGRSIDRAQSQKSILIGLSVPQHEASVFWHRDGLTTPATPAIVLTSPDQDRFPARSIELAATNTGGRGRTRPISSMYSTVTCSNEVAEEDEIPPVPPIASRAQFNRHDFRSATAVAVGPSLRSVTAVHDEHQPPRLSPRPTDNLPDGWGTPRSQGWWNLLLSPLLSRAGSTASRRDPERGHWPSPVPAVPAMPPNIAEDGSPDSLQHRTSPETPRRLGFAKATGIPWSNWDEWETQKAVATKQVCGSESVEWLHWKANGTAAEYYEACTVEESTGHPYFECINHSCSAHRPAHGSTGNGHGQKEVTTAGPPPSSQTKVAVTLGSPFDDQKHKNANAPVRSMPEIADDEGSVTEFESDEEPDGHAVVDEHSPLIGQQETATPAASPRSPEELSPNVRKANTAAVVRAKALGSKHTSKRARQPVASPRLLEMPNIAAVIPEERQIEPSVPSGRKKTEPQALPSSLLQKPVPALPESPDTRGKAPMGSGLTSSAPLESLVGRTGRQGQPRSHAQILSHQFFINPKGGLSGLPSTPTAARTFRPVPRPQSFASSDRESYSTTSEKPRRRKQRDSEVNWRSRYLSWLRCLGRQKAKDDREKKKKKKEKKNKNRRRLAGCICFILLLIVILCVVLAITITRKRDQTTVGSRWLNLTGYPPMPTGVSTIAQPALTRNQDRCVQPATLWSCSLPKDDPSRSTSNGSGLPQFRFAIRYRNGTTPANMNIPLGKRADPFTDDLYTPNPAPPNDPDQLFLGNTTDNVTAPFNGEVTPFYISFMPTFPVVPPAFNTSKKTLDSRQTPLENNIPAPAALPDGTAALTSLLPSTPYPASQPIRLYNRGLVDEHYGFYLYFDKSIFLLGVSISNGTAGEDSGIASDADRDGGSTKATARARCTWQQSRFLVKIFTSSKFDGTLISRPPNATTTTVDASAEGQSNSATDFSVPGSFPYPTSIVIDRHGGNINTKIAYCFGMGKGIVDQDEKLMILEDRAVGGSLINGAPSFIDSGSDNRTTIKTGAGGSSFDAGAGGIDGGTGGCSCQWQNWR